MLMICDSFHLLGIFSVNGISLNIFSNVLCIHVSGPILIISSFWYHVWATSCFIAFFISSIIVGWFILCSLIIPFVGGIWVS